VERLIARILRGSSIAVLIKVVVLALTLSILGFLAISALATGEIFIAAFIFLSMVLMGFTYLTNKAVPMKFFLPGMLLLIAFVVAPIVYTVTMSGFNFQTGNYTSKSNAIEIIQSQGVVPDESGSAFDVRIGRDGSGNLQLLVTDYLAQKYYIATEDQYVEVPVDQVELDEFEVAFSAPGFTLIPEDQLPSLDKELNTYRFFYSDEYYLILEGFDFAAVYKQSLVYDPETDSFTNLQTGELYKDNGRGNFIAESNSEEVLMPGWRAPIWFENYVKLVTDPQVSGPLVSVFIWTISFAFLTVLTQFAFGLLLALALDKKLRGRRFYRTVLILPYAVPSIMSILIWAGMFNSEFGAINALLGTDIAWFRDGNFAKFAVLLVNLWLGFPYFYLVSSGALQAIPTELSEAASIDGARPFQIFRMITLPLLLKILTPLLISSFAFNFNNFNLIYLLTGGGPRNDLEGEVAGATDILISYTFRIAFGAETQNLGLASAISVVIFILVAVISLYGIRKSKVLDEFL
jgi:arabinogalactan oligomer/maltooligosaccharide transport system permease protein